MSSQSILSWLLVPAFAAILSGTISDASHEAAIDLSTATVTVSEPMMAVAGGCIGCIYIDEDSPYPLFPNHLQILSSCGGTDPLDACISNTQECYDLETGEFEGTCLWEEGEYYANTQCEGLIAGPCGGFALCQIEDGEVKWVQPEGFASPAAPSGSRNRTSSCESALVAAMEDAQELKALLERYSNAFRYDQEQSVVHLLGCEFGRSVATFRAPNAFVSLMAQR